MEPRADHERGETTLHSEELQIDTTIVETGSVRIHKDVTTETTSIPAERTLEDFDTVDRVAANAEDSGQIEELEDGSISIPILEEHLVITKRVVVRERVIIRKRVTTVVQQIDAELRTEHVTIESQTRTRP